MLYSEKVMDHFRNPRNVGEIENADGVGQVGNAKCGDIMRMTLKIDDGVITDARFDGVNEAGGLKSEDEAYAGRMRPLCGTDPAGIRQYYSDALTGLDDPKDLEADGVSGATVSAQHFEALWQALQSPMKKGETSPVVVADIPEFSPEEGIGE